MYLLSEEYDNHDDDDNHADNHRDRRACDDPNRILWRGSGVHICNNCIFPPIAGQESKSHDQVAMNH